VETAGTGSPAAGGPSELAGAPSEADPVGAATGAVDDGDSLGDSVSPGDADGVTVVVPVGDGDDVVATTVGRRVGLVPWRAKVTTSTRISGITIPAATTVRGAGDLRSGVCSLAIRPSVTDNSRIVGDER